MPGQKSDTSDQGSCFSKARETLTRQRARFRKLLRLLRDRRYWRPLSRGVAASVEHADVPFQIDAKTIIDVGASKGQFALFAERRFPNARVFSFEPLPGPASTLSDVTGQRVEVEVVALGAEPGSAELNVSSQDDSSSLLPIGERQVREFPGTARRSTTTVNVSTLDSAMGEKVVRPCLLKIDVQGLELEVLNGGPAVLRQVDEALVECSFVELYEGQALADQIIALMLGCEMRLAGVYGTTFSASGESIQADLHFRRSLAGQP